MRAENQEVNSEHSASDLLTNHLEMLTLETFREMIGVIILEHAKARRRAIGYNYRMISKFLTVRIID